MNASERSQPRNVWFIYTVCTDIHPCTAGIAAVSSSILNIYTEDDRLNYNITFYYSLDLDFVSLTTISISYHNFVLTQVIAGNRATLIQ